jgi:S1-C subfamily serine protease
MQKLVTLLKLLTENTRVIKGMAAAGVLALSFAATSYYIARHAAAEEQRQDDYINTTVGANVVEIRDVEGKKGGGTGFLVNTPSDNTFILTNNHVCGLANASGMLLIDQEYYAQVVANSPDHDLCLVSNPLNWDGISIADTSRDGQDVYLVGHPLLDPPSLVKGEISGTLDVRIFVGYNLPCDKKNDQKIDLSDNPFAVFFGLTSACIRTYEAQATTINVLPGNSGSPVVNHAGKLVGVAFAGREDGPGRGYIVPLSYVIKFLEDK